MPHCYYLISVSDDALAAYEMRGLPVRDAFDSAFDEVIHVLPGPGGIAAAAEEAGPDA